MVRASKNTKEEYVKWVYANEGFPLDKFVKSGWLDIGDIACCEAFKNVSLSLLLSYTDQLSTRPISSRPDLKISHLANTNTSIWTWSIVTENTSISFQEIAATYTKYPWDWKSASRRPDLDFKFVLSHPELKWSWDHLSSRVNLEDYKKFPTFPWNFQFICVNPNFPITELVKIPQVDYGQISANPGLSLEYVRANSEKDWDLDILSERKDFGVSDIRTFITKITEMDWNLLSRNIPVQDILQNTDLPWTSYVVSSRKIDLKTVLDNPTFPWHWPKISLSPAITLSEITSNMNLPWDWEEVTNRPDVLTSEFMKTFIIRHQELPWDWKRLSSGDPDTILDNKNLPWHWDIFSENPKLRIRHATDPKNAELADYWGWWYTLSYVTPIEIIRKNPKLPWIASGILKNPEITPELIEEFPKLFWVNIWTITYNNFLYDSSAFYRRFRKDIKTRKSQVRDILKDSHLMYDDIMNKVVEYVGYC